MTVDEILATGRYTDRQGREWKRGPSFVCNRDWFYLTGIHRGGYANDAEMRLLIARDMHRDECRGLAVCEDHPVPSVNCYSGAFEVWQSGRLWSRTQGRDYGTLPAAMAAARALVVAE